VRWDYVEFRFFFVSFHVDDNDKLVAGIEAVGKGTGMTVIIEL